MKIRSQSTATLVAALLSTLLASCDQGESAQPGGDANAKPASWPASNLAGEILLADSTCTACHTASPAAIRRLGTAPAPQLLGDEGIGQRLSLPAIASRLGAHHDDLGMRMPDLFEGVDDPEGARSSVAQFLASQGGPLDPAPTETSEAMAGRGKTLFSQIGCVACHENNRGFDTLAAAWTLPSLSGFLEDPLAAHPAGRMPGMNLTTSEARAIASYLLRRQLDRPDGAPNTTAQPGLRLEFFKGEYRGGGPVEERRTADITTFVSAPEVGPGKGKDNFGLRLTGGIEIPKSGRWSFWLTSDDGSHLYIDGELLIDNGGVHAPSEKRGSVRLDEGVHSITVTMFEAGGGEELSLSWSGPGIPRDRIPGSAFTSEVLTLLPAWPRERLDPKRVAEGEAFFVSLGCTACHEPGRPLPKSMAAAPPLASLLPDRGCLAETVAASLPNYAFTAQERSDINAVLADVESLEQALPAPVAIAHAMTRLDCIACHARATVGGPDAKAKLHFVSDDDAELGDEGRLPPELDDVGNKLRLSALREVLLRGTKIRPYMTTRMPVFGAAQVEDLVVHFAAADSRSADGIEPPFTVALALTGHTLAGEGGVSCIQCHTAAGHPSLGVPAIDLTQMHARIRPGWFRAHLLDPQKTNPGTRMTSFWGNGGTDRIFPEHETGDPTRQVDAIWSYLSLGESMPLPKGIVPDLGTYALIPIDEPITIGVFMKDTSARTIAVGFPEAAHYAWDLEHGRLALCWRGEFMNAESTWHGRNANLQTPSGSSVLRLPPGHAIEVLSNRAAAWPLAEERDAAGRREDGWRVRGVERDLDRRPMFVLEGVGVQVREQIVPRLARGGTHLNRRFTVQTDASRGDLYMRAAVAPSIKLGAGEGRHRRWTIGPERTIEIRGAESFVREDPNGIMELIVKVPLVFAGREDADFEGTFEVEMSW